MLKVKVNNAEHQIEFDASDNSKGKLNGKDFSLDLINVKEGSFHLLKNNKSFNIEIVKADYSDKEFVIQVNGNKYTLNVKDKFDLLLKDLGMENLASAKINEVKAPMPGLVLDILVQAGTEVKKGDALMILEAMKMENILKSPADGKVKKINIEKKQAVEKNQVLIFFE